MVRLHRLPDLEAQDSVRAQERREHDERLEREAKEHHWQGAEQKHQLTEHEFLQRRAIVGQVSASARAETHVCRHAIEFQHSTCD
jgi:hypothetical protein